MGFPLALDLYDQCTDAYKKELDGPRAAANAADEISSGVHHKRQKTTGAPAAAGNSSGQPSSSSGGGGGCADANGGAAVADVDMAEAAPAAEELQAVVESRELIGKHAGQLTGARTGAYFFARFFRCSRNKRGRGIPVGLKAPARGGVVVRGAVS